MGSAIHAAIEVQGEGQTEYRPFARIYFAEDPRLAVLAGAQAGQMRRDPGVTLPPVVEPRGLPEDLSPELRDVMQDKPPQTATWLTYTEIYDLNSVWCSNFGGFNQELVAVSMMMSSLHHSVGDTRLVLWLDS